LHLTALPLAAFEALAAGDVEQARSAAGLPLPDGWPKTYPWRMWADALRADPDRHPWAARAAVLAATGEVVANVGFHGPPDGGMVEVGYTVEAAHRRRGVAVEAVTAILRWASSQPGVTTLRASTAPDNTASQQVLHRLGFEPVGTQTDEVDGLERVFTRPAYAAATAATRSAPPAPGG
jgi:RimJ/RimL family protein N-acetyltransferase